MNERSYGVVPLKQNKKEWQVLLVQHGTALYWGFPKGHPEASETPQETAKRELFEETNLEVVRFFSHTPFEQHYKFIWKGKLIHKTVGYFAAEVKGTPRIQADEIKSCQWVPLEKACEVITYPTDQSVCREIIDLFISTS